MATRRPKTLVLLLIFFCWLEAKSLGYLVFPAMSASYHYYAALDLAWMHFAVTILTVAVAAAATRYLWPPRPGWLKVTLVAAGFFLVSTVVAAWHTVAHLAEARIAYATARTARGLPVPSDRLDAVFQPSVIVYTAVGTVAFVALLVAAAWRHRTYVDARYLTVGRPDPRPLTMLSD